MCNFSTHLLSAPDDYQAVNASYTIPVGSTELFVNFSIASDSVTENPESLRVTLSDPSVGATIADLDAVSTVNVIDQQGMMNMHEVTCHCA